MATQKHLSVHPTAWGAMLCLLAAAASGQTFVPENGRALDAPGSANDFNVPPDATLTAPVVPSVTGSVLSTPFRTNVFTIDTNLQSLSAVIDPNNTQPVGP